MSRLFELIKVDLRETLDIRKFKENKGKSISFFAFLALMLILFLFLSVVYNLMFISLFQIINANVVYATMFMGGFASILCLTTSVVKVKGIFSGKDYEMLKSMPIKKTEIIAAKIINLYLIELLYAAIIMIPNGIIATIFSGDFLFLLTGVITSILIPAIPMAVSCIISLFITLVADRFKFGNVISSILYFGVFALIMYFSFFMGTTSSTQNADGVLDMANIFGWINPSLQLIKFSHINNYLFSLLFIAGNLIIMFLVVLFISLFFDKVHEIVGSFKSNNKYVRKKLETRGQFKALFTHEFKRFITSKLYFFNSLASGICAIMMSVFMSYMFSPFSTITDTQSIISYIREYAYIGILVIAFGIGISTPASASISVEGSKFWMVKSFPIDYKKLIKAKLLVSIITLGICSLISSTIIVIMIQPSIYSSILLFVGPLLFVTLASILGLLINLSYYKLKWKNEQQFCKNSASIVISMLLDWVIMIVLGAVLIGFSFINIYLAGLSTIVLLLIACIIFYSILIKSTDRKISAIEEF